MLAFHCDLGLTLGGYVGVDVFFVLSGFLITGLLLDAANDPAARGVDMLRFYARRARRLLPMALLVIVSISAAWLLTVNAVDRAPLVADGRSAALYFSNWHFAATATDYFASQNAPSPFVHFWSLSVEEQFYLVWPALIAFIYWRCAAKHRAQTVVGVVAVALMAASLAALAVTTANGDASYAYFGTHTRAYQLLAGAALAVALRRRQPGATAAVANGRAAWSALQVVSLAALLLVATREIDLGPGMRGVTAVACTVALLLALTAAPAGPVRRLLSVPAVVYLGQISYAAYLWHWPVILLIRRFVVISPHLLLIPAFALSFGLAALSQRLLERPIRVSPVLARYGRASVACGLALSLLIGLLVAPALLESTRRPAITAAATAPTGSDSTSTAAVVPKPVPTGSKHTPVPSVDAIKEAARAHPIGGPACIHRTGRLCAAYAGGPRKVLVVGDSHVEALLPVFIAIAKRTDISLYTWMSYMCPWERGVVPGSLDGNPAQGDSCRGAQNDLYGTAMTELRPDVTIVVNRGYDDPNFPWPLFIDGSPGRTDAGPVLALATPNAVQSVLALSKRLVVVEPWPSLTQSQPSCLAAARWQEQCVMSAAVGKLPEETAIEAVAAKDPRVGVVDLDSDVCPRLPLCDPVIGGTIVRRDQDHLSITFAAALTDRLRAKLSKAGVFGTF